MGLIFHFSPSRTIGLVHVWDGMGWGRGTGTQAKGPVSSVGAVFVPACLAKAFCFKTFKSLLSLL